MNKIDPIPQIEKMRAGVDYHHTLKVREYRVKMRPLSINEEQEVADEVATRLGDMRPESRSPLVEHILLAKIKLEKASTSDVGVVDPQLTEAIMGRMTADEIKYLFQQYVALMNRCNPCLEFMKPEDLHALVDDLKKNSPQDLDLTLTELSFLELASLARHLLTPEGSPTDK